MKRPDRVGWFGAATLIAMSLALAACGGRLGSRSDALDGAGAAVATPASPSGTPVASTQIASPTSDASETVEPVGTTPP